MNHPTSQEPSKSPQRGQQGGNRFPGLGRKAGGAALVVLLALYSFLAPRLNDRFGWDLPQVNADSGQPVRLPETSQQQPDRSQADRPSSAAKERFGEAVDASDPSVVEPAAERSSEDLRYGLLREVSPDRYLSPAGLLYAPGSAEGHRLEHLKRHTRDDPGRPGSHGVFDDGMEGALKTIDRAYEQAREGRRSTQQSDKGRTIYTVDLGARIGYVGGRDGGRRRNPMARRVRLILEGNRVITAYPL